MQDVIMLSEERFKEIAIELSKKTRTKLSDLASNGMLLDSHTIPLIAICIADFADDLRKELFHGET